MKTFKSYISENLFIAEFPRLDKFLTDFCYDSCDLKTDGYAKNRAKVTDVSGAAYSTKLSRFMIKFADFQKIVIRSIEFEKKDDKVTFIVQFMEAKKFLNIGSPYMIVNFHVMNKNLKISKNLDFQYDTDKNAIAEFKRQNIGPKLKELYKSVK
jgi:hypothetical protein